MNKAEDAGRARKPYTMNENRLRAIRECEACRRNIAAGGDPDFWRWRLQPYLDDLEVAAYLVRYTISRLPRQPHAAEGGDSDE